MAMTDQGYAGEWLCLQYLHHKGMKSFQVDWVTYDPVTGEWYNYEVKHKCPFRTTERGLEYIGHGVANYQVEARMNHYKSTGIRYRLFYIDFTSHRHVRGTIWNVDVYSAWLNELEETHSYIDIRSRSGQFFHMYDRNAFVKETMWYDDSKYDGRIGIRDERSCDEN